MLYSAPLLVFLSVHLMSGKVHLSSPHTASILHLHLRFQLEVGGQILLSLFLHLPLPLICLSTSPDIALTKHLSLPSAPAPSLGPASAPASAIAPTKQLQPAPAPTTCVSTLLKKGRLIQQDFGFYKKIL